MSSCAGCGQTARSSDRFCPRCGLPLAVVDEPGDFAPPSSSLRRPETIGDTEDRVRRDTIRSGVRTAGISLLVVAVAILAWMTMRTPTTSVPGLAGELAGPPTTAAEVSANAADRVTTRSLAGERTEQADGVIVVDPDRLDPALAGYRLLAARDGEIIDIDLATGEATTHSTAGRLIGSFDGLLIAVDQATGVTAVPLDDAATEPEPVLTVDSAGSAVMSAVVDESGILQVTTVNASNETPQPVMTRIDLASGSTVSAEASAFGAMGLVEVSGGGLFSLDEEGFRRLTEASVELFGSAYLVVERCDDPQQCDRFWVQRSPGVRVGRPLPAFRSGYVLGPNGRVAVGTESDGVRFFDVRLAREVPIVDAYRTPDGLWFVVEDLTDDDRFLAAVVGATGNDVLIHDLDEQSSVRFELGRSSPLSKVLFVPKADRG